MWCEQREHLLAEYRKVVAERTAPAVRVGGSNDAPAALSDSLAEDVRIAATAIARGDLREHVDEHGCWTHSVYSSLFFLWRDNRADAPEAFDERSQAAC